MLRVSDAVQQSPGLSGTMFPGPQESLKPHSAEFYVDFFLYMHIYNAF